MTSASRFPILVATLLVGCAPAAPDTEPVDTAADTEAIQGSVDSFLAAFNAGDFEALGSLYTEDIVQLAPDGPVLEGRAATVQGVTDFVGEYDATQTATTDEVRIDGDVAFARGTWTVRQAPRSGGDELVRNGKWLVVLDRQADGGWLISRWIWNEEGTAPAM